MKCLVTGAAGFIGSHLCEELLRSGHQVLGLDALIPYYSPQLKQRNESAAAKHPGYHAHRLDLRSDPLDSLLGDVEVIFHLAAMPGLPESWTNFDSYLTCNTQATQRLLEATVRSAPRLRSFVYASTSSVYGRFASGDESLPTKPISPYGVTKLAAEHLCRSYSEANDIPLTILRYFSVYGPRQRPDMGYYKFMEALAVGRPITVYGDGQQVRSNTFVTDCVAATIAAADVRPGEIYNVGGGEMASVWDILHKLEQLTGRTCQTRQEAARPGDQRHTFADTRKLQAHTGWKPRVSLDEGLALQWRWFQEQSAASASPGS